jgi:hypothetical protein
MVTAPDFIPSVSLKSEFYSTSRSAYGGVTRTVKLQSSQDALLRRTGFFLTRWEQTICKGKVTP